MFSINHIDHAVLDTANLAECIGFYEQTFSMRSVGWEASQALKFGVQKLNLHPSDMSFSPVAGNPAPGGKAIVLQISSDNLFVWKKLQGQLATGEDWFENFPGAVTIHDPDHDLIIASLTERPLPEPLFLQGILLPTRKFDSLLSFYTRFLGANIVRGKDAAIMGFEYGYLGLLRQNNDSLTEKEFLIPGTGDFCLIANGFIEEIYEELKEMGAPFDSNEGIVQRHGAQGEINSVYLRDPDGNLVEISTLAEHKKPES